MKIKVSEATNAQLDWLVTHIENVKTYGVKDGLRLRSLTRTDRWSTDWSQGGPLIEREKIEVHPYGQAWRAQNYWSEEHKSYVHAPMFSQTGPTPLIAAMRCYVASMRCFAASQLVDEAGVVSELM